MIKINDKAGKNTHISDLINNGHVHAGSYLRIIAVRFMMTSFWVTNLMKSKQNTTKHT